MGSATPALSQEAKNDDPGPSYYIPALADAGPVQRRTDVAVITKAVRAIHTNDKPCLLGACDGRALALLITPRLARCRPPFKVN